MAIDSTKILTISLSDWAKLKGKDLIDYDVEGVQVRSHSSDITEKFLEKVPESAEVVVDYQYAGTTTGNNAQMAFMIYASGTAVIPKDK